MTYRDIKNPMGVTRSYSVVSKSTINQLSGDTRTLMGMTKYLVMVARSETVISSCFACNAQLPECLRMCLAFLTRSVGALDSFMSQVPTMKTEKPKIPAMYCVHLQPPGFPLHIEAPTIGPTVGPPSRIAQYKAMTTARSWGMNMSERMPTVTVIGALLKNPWNWAYRQQTLHRLQMRNDLRIEERVELRNLVMRQPTLQRQRRQLSVATWQFYVHRLRRRGPILEARYPGRRRTLRFQGLQQCGTLCREA